MRICPTCSELFPDDAAFCPFDRSALEKPKDPMLGRTLAARYRLVKRLGSGGMSLVYLARHVLIERLSAIKILRQDLGLDPTHRERFLREARAVNRINHRNIVEITDFGEHEGLVYLVMAYVAGEPLHAHIRRARLAWARAAKIGVQIASALGRAHQAGVIHRDLKPENVMVVTDEGEEIVKLTDFGIAKIEGAPALTFSEQMFGTPGYIAPEYLEGIPADGRADLYALGVLLYEMVTQMLPYEARGQADLLMLPLKAAPIPASQRAPGLPPDLDALLLRLLARRAEDRPRDAFEVHDALIDLLRRHGAIPNPRATDSDLEKTSEKDPDPDDEPTVSEDPAKKDPTVGAVAAAERQTREVGAFPTIEIASRWHAALAELEASIARAKKRGGRHVQAAERGAALVENARNMVASVERASSRVAEHQARVDRLDARGRAFRANLGHAIDELLRERSRERAHAEAIGSRRNALADEAKESGDAEVWEVAALDAEHGRAGAREEDLTFQIETLQKQLDRENEELERELLEAAGALEGSISALRLLTSEIVRTLDEAAAALTSR
jgi:serine/threonine-protein kinase